MTLHGSLFVWYSVASSWILYAVREDLSKFSYTTMCIKETLRLYLLTILIGKLSSEDVVADGYKVPKGMFTKHSTICSW